MPGHSFRAGVVIVVRRPDGDVMAFERADAPGQWQLPQGGLHRGETPLDAAWRELAEETGLGSDDVELVSEHDEWVVTPWPVEVVGAGSRLGQVQRWFEFRVRADDIEPVPDGREFQAWKWVAPSWLVANVVAFKQPGYARLLTSRPRG